MAPQSACENTLIGCSIVGSTLFTKLMKLVKKCLSKPVVVESQRQERWHENADSAFRH